MIIIGVEKTKIKSISNHKNTHSSESQRLSCFTQGMERTGSSIVKKSSRLRPQFVRTYSLALICFYMVCPRTCAPFPPNLFLDVKIGRVDEI